MKNILFINNALSGTGGARVILNLAKSLRDRGHKVALLLDRVDNIHYKIDDGIEIYVRDKFKIKKVNPTTINKNDSQVFFTNQSNSVFFNFIKLYAKKLKSFFYFLKAPCEMYAFKKFINTKKFDAIVNNNVYVNVDRIYFESKLSNNYYVNFHNSPIEIFSRREFSTLLPLSKIFRNVKLLSASKGIADELLTLKGFNDKEIITIYNPFNFTELEGNSRIQCEGNIPLPKEFIVTVSTLTDRKRVDRTIKAMPKIIREYGEIDLLIIGEGQLRNDLQNLVKELNIEKYVHFLGFQTNPYYFINKAQLLILSSDSEGLPTVIIESLILGTPVLSTDCPTGPNEILVNWGDESLVSLTKTSDENNICNELAEKAIRLLCKKYDKKYVKHKSDLQRFDEKKISTSWEILF